MRRRIAIILATLTIGLIGTSDAGYYEYMYGEGGCGGATCNLTGINLTLDEWINFTTSNILLGDDTYALTTGSDNFFAGTDAGIATTTGKYNAYIGKDAGKGATASDGNFIAGFRAFDGLAVSALDNTCIGRYTCGNMLTGDYNLAIGYTALNNGAYTTGNIALGYETLYSASSSSSGFNVAIGHSAGYSQTGEKSIFIGYNAGYNADASNVLYIDNSNTATPLIYGDFATDSIVINGDHKVTGMTALNTSTELTIATGAIIVTKSFHSVDTESDAASDDLDTISGGSAGDILVIRADNSARTVVAKDGTGNLKLAGDMTLDNAEDTLQLIFDGSNWLEMSRSDNGA